MDRLKFDKSHVGVVGAAVTLAINQEPWASYVRCSILDYYDAGLARRGCGPHQVLLKKPGADLFSCGELKDIDLEETLAHRVTIYPDNEVDSGEVAL